MLIHVDALYDVLGQRNVLVNSLLSSLSCFLVLVYQQEIWEMNAIKVDNQGFSSHLFMVPTSIFPPYDPPNP